MRQDLAIIFTLMRYFRQNPLASPSSVPTGKPCKALRITPRSLRNQLSRESASFQQIKAQVRQQLAIQKLLASALPISSVALELGFSEPGDFSRNFKRWTGLSPSEYRAKHSKS